MMAPKFGKFVKPEPPPQNPPPPKNPEKGGEKPVPPISAGGKGKKAPTNSGALPKLKEEYFLLDDEVATTLNPNGINYRVLMDEEGNVVVQAATTFGG